jgi:sn-glycerol 3-phosphate transport system permease protein
LIEVPTASKTATRPSRRRRDGLVGFAMIAPTLLIVVVFTFIPVVMALVSSLTRHRENPGPIPAGTFMGLDNYGRLLETPAFQQVLVNTVVFVVVTVGVSVPLALGFALALNRVVRGVGYLRTSIAYPTFLPMVGAGAMWLFLYNLNFGLVNDLMRLFGVERQNWLGDPHLALPAIMVMTIWRFSSYFMIFYLAGLQSVPSELIDASQVDGAGWWQSVRHVVVPLLRPVTLFVTITALIFSFQTYDQIAVMTKDGGPANATNMLLFNARLEFAFGRYDLANAQTVMLVIILFAFTGFYYLNAERRTTYLGD